MSELPTLGIPPKREHIPAHYPEAYPDGPSDKFDRDVNLKVVVYTGVGLAVLSAVAIVLMWWFSVALRESSIDADRPPSPLIEANQPVLPPGPRLQGAPGSAFEERAHSPELELRQLREEEMRRLSTFGYVSEEGGTAHIPIERAMAMLAAGAGEAAPADGAAAAGPMRRHGEIPPSVAARERASGSGMGELPPGAETVTLDEEADSLTAGDPTETNPLDVPATSDGDQGGDEEGGEG